MKEKPHIDVNINTRFAKRNLLREFSKGKIKHIKFGKIRYDQTRGVTFYYKYRKPDKTLSMWTRGSYSYLTDIPRRRVR